MTVANGERRFSKLKLINTYLRSTKSDDRLSSLTFLSIENSISQSLDLSNAILEFSKKKVRKEKFL